MLVTYLLINDCAAFLATRFFSLPSNLKPTRVGCFTPRINKHDLARMKRGGELDYLPLVSLLLTTQMFLAHINAFHHHVALVVLFIHKYLNNLPSLTAIFSRQYFYIVSVLIFIILPVPKKEFLKSLPPQLSVLFKNTRALGFFLSSCQ